LQLFNRYRFLKFFHIIDSTGLSVLVLYLAEDFVLYGVPMVPEISK
jgi:hypothetical protein